MIMACNLFTTSACIWSPELCCALCTPVQTDSSANSPRMLVMHARLCMCMPRGCGLNFLPRPHGHLNGISTAAALCQVHPWVVGMPAGAVRSGLQRRRCLPCTERDANMHSWRPCDAGGVSFHGSGMQSMHQSRRSRGLPK